MGTERSREELRVGIQARMRMMMAQKETIERELAKLQLLELEECPSRPAPPLLPPKPVRRETADTSQDSGVDSGAVTDDGETKVLNSGLLRRTSTSSSTPSSGWKD